MDKKNLPIQTAGRIVGIYPKSLSLSVQWFVQYYSAESPPRKMKMRVPNLSTSKARLAAAESIIIAIEKAAFMPPPTSARPTVKADVVKKAFEVLDNRKSVFKNQKTFQQFESQLLCLNDWCVLNKIQRIDESTAERFLDSLRNDGLNPVTVNNYRATFNCLLNRAVKFKLLKTNPFKLTETLDGESESADWYRRDDVVRMKEWILENRPYLWIAIQWIFYCLMRPASLRNLKIGDIDFDRWQIRLRSANTKNAKFYYVAIPTAFQSVLQTLNLRDYSSDFYVVGRDGLPSTERVSEHWWYNANLAAIQALGIQGKYHLYSWKHTGFSIQYLEGKDTGIGILELMKQAGHSSPEQSFAYLRKLGLEDFTAIRKMAGI